MDKVYLRYKASTDGWPDHVPFEKGDSAVLVSGNWLIPEFELVKPQLAGLWVASTFPKGPGGKRTSYIGGTGIGIMSWAVPEVRDAAAEFIGFLYTREAVRAESNYAGSQKSMYIPPVPEFMDLMPISDANKEGLRRVLSEAVGPSICKGWNDVAFGDVTKAIQEMVLNGADLEQSLKAAAAAMDAALKG